MYVPNSASAMSINEIRYFIFEKCYKCIGFSKEKNSSEKKKKKPETKITQQPKSFENSNIADKKISYYRASKKFT